jgi:hypothetical protein
MIPIAKKVARGTRKKCIVIYWLIAEEASHN